MIAPKAKDMKSFIVMDVLERAQEMERRGEEVIHLEIGEPDFDTPESIKAACLRAIREGKTHYTHSQGLLQLREAICEKYGEKYGVEISPEQVLITSGTSPAMLLLFSALLEPGDEVILPNPHYPCYPNIISYAGGKPIFVETEETEGFQYLPQRIRERISSRTKGVLINSPSNPTGIVMEQNRMEEIASLPTYIISDEIYHGLVYKGKEHTILEFTNHCFVLNGFSKLYAMTGWRLGYLIAPREFIRPMQVMQQNLFISPNSFVQWAGIAALREAQKEVEEMKEIYNRRREFMLKKLQQLGLRVAVEPTGAFYILANAQKFSSDSYRLAFDILEKARVGVTPGTDFGSRAEGFLRFSYANSLENIEEAMERLRRYLEGL
ncbi:MAG: pyridoxal phosphate-dependent aminotransferase [Deltaproteobacteria bacterium]|nr:MAG: pyridoxal phosphate-dependent aminotransferase [Deltaproteobacteria bacterium]